MSEGNSAGLPASKKRRGTPTPGQLSAAVMEPARAAEVPAPVPASQTKKPADENTPAAALDGAPSVAGDAAPPEVAVAKSKRQWDAWTNREFTAFFEAVVQVSEPSRGRLQYLVSYGGLLVVGFGSNSRQPGGGGESRDIPGWLPVQVSGSRKPPPLADMLPWPSSAAISSVFGKK